ncbi:hypothetical protein ACSVDE_02185 [Pseudalkalibacillus sp. Hm43]|uniref:hypothetical protein n=1 Tax=Pseudalkalibacillus sp. Hm43 TaxID=3450742 RepID=UPI003F4426EA
MLLLVLPFQALATSWVYPFVVWDGFMYEVTDDYITDVEREIGHVTSYSDMNTMSGNFSNAYRKGTKYYEITGVSTDEAIAVEIGKVQYKKAFRRGEYAYTNSPVHVVQKGTTIVLIGLLIAAVIYFLIRMRRIVGGSS